MQTQTGVPLVPYWYTTIGEKYNMKTKSINVFSVRLSKWEKYSDVRKTFVISQAHKATSTLKATILLTPFKQNIKARILKPVTTLEISSGIYAIWRILSGAKVIKL